MSTGARGRPCQRCLARTSKSTSTWRTFSTAYLWGALVTDGAQTGLVNECYVDFATWDELTAEAELHTFTQFWTWLSDLLATAAASGRSVLAYCWHESAENTQLRRIGSHIPALAMSIDAFIDSGRWGDLERTFKGGWITGSSTSLKAIAPLASFSWPVDDPGGGLSMVRYLAAAGDEPARPWLTQYNRGDVEATRAIREWLDQHGGDWPVLSEQSD